jgi:outer membrane lipoprotein-sorting protein
VVWVSLGLYGQTADEIADKVIAATGGVAEFAKVESLQIKGRMKFGDGNFSPITVFAKRPNRYRMELNIGPDHVVQAYDGKVGWQSIDGDHKQPPTPLEGVSLAHLIDQAANAIGGPLLDRTARQNVVQLTGRANVNGVDCHKLEVTLGTGDKMTLFVDAKTFLIMREEVPIEMNAAPGLLEETVGDYRQFGSVKLACLFVTHPQGAAETENQRMEFESVEVNPPLDVAIFSINGK